MGQIVWRKFNAISMDGTTRDYCMPPMADRPEELLHQIMSMPRENKKPLNYDTACNLFAHEFCKRIGVRPPEETRDFYSNEFANWISQQGFYIELRGDEYKIPTKQLQ